MEWNELLKEWRFWLFSVALIAAIVSIGFAPWKSGVVVSSISSDSPLAGDVTTGSTIKSINEEPIKSPEDLQKWQNFTGLMRVVHDGEVSLVDVEEAGLHMTVRPVSTTNLALGMDLTGGSRVLYEPQYPENMTTEEQAQMAQDIITTLETRINVYGLRELPIRPVQDVGGKTFIQIETTEGTLDDIQSLIERRGNFEAFIQRDVAWTDSHGTLTVGKKNYTFMKVGNDSIRLNDKTYGINDTFRLKNITFEVRNVTSLRAELGARVFTSDDVAFVSKNPRQSYVREANGGWQFAFGVTFSDEGGRRFADVTAPLEEVQSVAGGGQCYLDQQLELYLDRRSVSNLNIVCGLRGNPTNQHQITGGASSEEQARQEMKELQTVMESGSLPVPLEQARVDTVSATLGEQFTSSVAIAGVLAFLGVASIVYFRYRRMDVVAPMLFISLSEIVMILGTAAAIKWTIDLASVAGVIAAIGSGVDDQIIIADEALTEKTFTTEERVKRAFFIVYGAAATVIAAMVPMGFIGIGVMRGFAITTIIGVLIGISITRPFYGRLVEYMID